MFAVIVDETRAVGPFAHEEDAEAWVEIVDCRDCRIVPLVHPTGDFEGRLEAFPADPRRSPYHNR